ncbi:MAG: hypothetical protein COB39_13160 [Marinosulfonomonas sp.]|nr:MAG: hypothetical protein COB39_13160 [Marinosulfonomonas sp.]
MGGELLARALGLPKSRLELLRGATSRDKVFGVKAWSCAACAI